MKEKRESKKLTASVFREGIQILLRYVMRYKGEVIILSIFALLSAISNGVVPYIAGKLIDTLILLANSETALRSVFSILLGWFVLQLAVTIIDWRIGLRVVRFRLKIYNDYTSNAIATLLKLPLSFHKDEKVGKVNEKISRTANALEDLAGNVLITVAAQMLSVIFALAFAFYISATLAVILVGSFFVYLITVYVTAAPLTKRQQDFHEVVSNVWGHLFDAVGNVQSVKQATNEKLETKNVQDGLENAFMVHWIGISDIWNKLNAQQQIVTVFTQLLIYTVAAFQIAGGNLTIGELVAFTAYAALMFGPLVILGRNWQSITNGIVSLVETEKILSLPIEEYKEGVVIDTTKPAGTVRFDNVSFGYEDDQEILFDISFEVEPGEKIALVGESGVGKSTLIDLIPAYYFPQKGSVTVDGINTREWPLGALRDKIAIVPQEIDLFNEDIHTNITYGSKKSKVTQSEMEEAARKASALEFIEKFPNKWKQTVGEDGVKLSSGQKQRIAIARAILRDPEILILDEPTSALDAISEVEITKALNTLMRGRTTFIVAHRLSTVRTADKILVFKKGRILQSGTHDELVNVQGEYKRLHDAHIGLRD